MKVIIVGGVAGGASCAARLRRLDEKAEILMVERGPYVSYANCGLPYHVGGVIPQEASLLVASEALFKVHFGIDARRKRLDAHVLLPREADLAGDGLAQVDVDDDHKERADGVAVEERLSWELAHGIIHGGTSVPGFAGEVNGSVAVDIDGGA